MNAVKKSIALLLSVCLLVGCVACSDGKSKDKDAKKETTAPPTTTTAVQNSSTNNDNAQNNEQPTQTQTPSQTTPGITYADISGYWGTSVNVGKLIESAVSDNLSEVDPAVAEVYRAAFQRIDPNLFVVDWIWNWRYQDAFIEMSNLYIEYDEADFEAKQATYVTEFNKVLGTCAAEQGFDYDLEEQLQDVADLIDDFMLYEFPQDFSCSPEFYCYNGKVYVTVTDVIYDLSELTDAMLADVTLSGNTMTVRSIPNADFEELLPLTFQRIG